jgi:putative component of toxin-antitoxin plasmid stabilization module
MARKQYRNELSDRRIKHRTIKRIMIQNILDLLPYVKDGSENIRIAKGQNYLPKNFKQAFKQFKNDMEWLKKSK